MTDETPPDAALPDHEREPLPPRAQSNKRWYKSFRSFCINSVLVVLGILTFLLVVAGISEEVEPARSSVPPSVRY